MGRVGDYILLREGVGKIVTYASVQRGNPIGLSLEEGLAPPSEK